MKNNFKILILLTIGFTFYACHSTKIDESTQATTPKPEMEMNIDDGRISLHLNPMQKQHQLSNMRAHLKAIQTILGLLAKDDYTKASTVAALELGSTTEMQLMCASFENETFETMGVNFHKSADEMSEVFKNKDKNRSLEALSTTINYCVSCHAAFKQ